MFKYILFALTISYVFSAQVFVCDDGKYIDGTKCKSCPKDCTKCISATVCTVCDEKYFLYTATNTCELKTFLPNNCVDIVDKAATTKVCKTCAKKFWLKNDKSCVVTALTNCLTWQSGVETEACATFNCTKIHTQCTTCTSGVVCTACNAGYFLSSNTVCTATTGNCGTWKAQSTEECASCPTGYTITNTKFCYASQCLFSVNSSVTCGSGKARSSAPTCNVTCIDANCDDCDDAAACTICKSEYLLFDRKCYNGVANCKTLGSATTCSVCLDTADKVGDVCYLKIKHCATMTSAAVCATCDAGYYKVGDICSSDCNAGCTCSAVDALCSACKDGYFFDSGAKTCTACETAHCKTCTPAATCTVCMVDYLIDSGACKTVENCAEMDSTITTCKTCKEDYFLSAAKTTCTVFIANCAAMESVDTCSTCKEGYGLATDKKSCTKCVDTKCKTCANEGKTCTACNIGYYADKTKDDTADIDAVCVQCTDANAKYVKTSCTSAQRVNFPWVCAALTGNCASNNPTPLIGEATQSCLTCSPEYKLDGVACTKCTQNNCYACSTNEAECSECNFGYYLKDADKSCVACDSTCQKCSPTECLDCKPQFGFQVTANLACEACLINCERCDVKTSCIKCSSGYFLNADSTACVGCSTNCIDCSDAETCKVCKYGSILDGKVCKGCFENCSTCTSTTTCIICFNGFYLNTDKTACKKQTTSTSGTGRECLIIVTRCMKCDATTTAICALCLSGSAPVEGKCSCDTGKLLIAGACVKQSTADLPTDYSDKDFTTIATYVTQVQSGDATAQATNTKNILERVNTILDGAKTDENAGKSLQLLLQFADTASNADAQTFYKTILTTVCGISTLSEANYYLAFAATDKALKNSTDKKGLYELGFSTCVTNLLKNVATISDISPMQMSNSEFTMQKFTKADKDKVIELTGVSAKLTEDFMTAIGDDTVYAVFKAIQNTANPYAAEQTNKDFTLNSKIVSFTVMTAGASAAVKTVKLADTKTFPITFDTAGTSGKCSYYDTTAKKWTADGTLTDKSCAFSHLTDFAIYKDAICDVGEYSDGTKCKQCPAECTKCTSSTVCIACNEKYFLYTNGISCELKTLLPTNCIDIVDKTAATKVCKTCANKFWLKTDKTCNPIALTTCSTWKSGVDTEACETFDCIKIHEKCILCSSGTGCTGCYSGFFLTADKTCAPCDSTCQKCSSTECLDCKPKYGFKATADFVCEACLANCERCDAKTACSKCSTGYFLNADSTACVGCTTNCIDCSDVDTCLTCKEGSILDGKVCRGCLENCKVCTSPIACTICNTGFNLNTEKTACTKSASTGLTGRECLTTVVGCMKCDQKASTTCSLCFSGSTPIEGNCSCETGKLLIAGACVTQANELPTDYSDKDLDTLTTYVTKTQTENATAQATNTKNILARVNTILDGAKTDENAGKSLQLLLQFADTASNADAQTSYKTILTTACGISTLSEANYYLAFAATDKALKSATDKKGLYELGYSTCVTNLLKNVATISDISPITMTNTEFTMRKFTKSDKDKVIELTGVSAKLTEDFMTAIGDDTVYAVFKAIPNTVNPYAAEQTNKDFTLNSKIVSFTVMTAGASAAVKTVKLADTKTFPITFDTAGTSGKCSYYDTTAKKWTADGTLTNKSCAFSHLTDFAIYKDTTAETGDNAYMLQVLSILLIFIVAMF